LFVEGARSQLFQQTGNATARQARTRRHDPSALSHTKLRARFFETLTLKTGSYPVEKLRRLYI